MATYAQGFATCYVCHERKECRWERGQSDLAICRDCSVDDEEG